MTGWVSSATGWAGCSGTATPPAPPAQAPQQPVAPDAAPAPAPPIKLTQAELEKLGQRRGTPFLRARPQHTGDNAGMIAFAAWAEREPGGVNPGDLALEIAPSQPLVLHE